MATASDVGVSLRHGLDQGRHDLGVTPMPGMLAACAAGNVRVG